MKCNICQSKTRFLFTAKVLKTHDVSYFKCEECGFAQTEAPYWLEEAYKDPVSIYDVGMVQRGLLWKPALERLIKTYFDSNAQFIDYGGGTGLLVRLMRDAGFDYYNYDPYSKNLFARGFDIENCLKRGEKFELLTAFEVFEHVEFPLQSVKTMFTLSDSILFTTLLQPTDEQQLSPEKWSYFATFTGQHISFYTLDSLRKVASEFGCNLYSDGEDVHLLSFKKMNLSATDLRNIVLPNRKTRIKEFLRSLLSKTEKIPEPTRKDYQQIMEKLKVYS